jgi:hypothetical protein
MVPMLRFGAVLSAALFTGGALYVSLAEHPARMADPVTARREFQHSYPRAAPWQASFAGICFLTAVLAALLTHAWPIAIGGIAVGAVIPFTLLVMMGTNHRILDEKSELNLNEATALLRSWGRLHWVRSILGLVGLIIMLANDVS